MGMRRTCTNPACPRINPQGLEEFYLNQRGRPRSICRTCHKAQTGGRYKVRLASGEGDELRRLHAKAEAARRSARRDQPTLWGWVAQRIRKHQAESTQQKARARLRMLAATVERVDAQEVYRRAAGICGLCFLPAPIDRWHLDHIVPLSRGGEHSYANVRVAHPHCNGWKGRRLDAELPSAPYYLKVRSLQDAADP